MSLQRMRRWSRLVAVMVLLAAVRGLPHPAQDDAACLPDPASYQGHDETDHVLAAAGQGHTDHCAVCHFTRLLRAPRAGFAVAAVNLVAPSRLHLADLPASAAPALEHLPARAPPVVLL